MPTIREALVGVPGENTESVAPIVAVLQQYGFDVDAELVKSRAFLRLQPEDSWKQLNFRQREVLEKVIEGTAAGLGKESATGPDLWQLLVGTKTPTAMYNKQLRSTGSVRASAVEPSSVEAWGSFHAEASEWAATLAPQLAGRPNPHEFESVYLVRTFEDELYALVFRVLLAVELVFRELGHGVSFVRHHEPDFLGSQASGEPLVAIEVKHRYALPTGCSVQEYDQLRDERTVELASGKTQGKRPDMLHVEQVAGYLSKSGCRYAVLCSDEQYFPIKLEDRQGRPTLQIAAPVQHNSLDPSVITAVAFVVHLALQNPPPLPPGNPVVAPPSGGGPPTGGQRRPKAKASISQQPVVLSADELSMGLSLGWGASGVVLAGQLADVPLAIKVWELRSNAPAPAEAWAAAQRAAMQREAAVYDRLAQLQGRHVPVAMACGTLITRAGDPLPFLAIERVEGGVPADLAAGSPGFTHEALAAAAVDAVAGLQALHALGVAHGDIRGDNVLLTPDGRAMFIDFGHARLDADEAAMRDEDGQLAELLMSPSGTALEVDGGAAGSAPAADGRGELQFLESSSRSLLLRSLPADDSGSERWAGGRAAEGAAEDPETAASPGEAPGGGGGPSNAPRGRNGGGTTRASALGDVRPLCRPLVLRGPHIPLLRRPPALPGLRRGPGTVVRAVH